MLLETNGYRYDGVYVHVPGGRVPTYFILYFTIYTIFYICFFPSTLLLYSVPTVAPLFKKLTLCLFLPHTGISSVKTKCHYTGLCPGTREMSKMVFGWILQNPIFVYIRSGWSDQN